MPSVKIAEENEKPDFIEIIAETTLENGETIDRRFKFKQRQMRSGIYKDILKSWAQEVHEDYEDHGGVVGDEIEF